MAKFKNTDGIHRVQMDGIKVRCFCPIGQSECTYQIMIRVWLDEYVPDYLEVGTFLDSLNTESLTLEAAAAKIFHWMMGYVVPRRVWVNVRCEDAKHMPAEVVKEGGWDDYEED